MVWWCYWQCIVVVVEEGRRIGGRFGGGTGLLFVLAKQRRELGNKWIYGQRELDIPCNTVSDVRKIHVLVLC